jgi:hypothetical protein
VYNLRGQEATMEILATLPLGISRKPIRNRVEALMSFQFPLHPLTLSIATALLLVNSALAQPAPVVVPASGYELSIGRDCTVGGVPATCGATFTGWTRETNTGDWLKFPGTGQGTWLVLI